jgi:HAD superfamily hydrolase (TIGR01509 family)
MITTVIFDMDGVISDTQKIHSRIETEIVARYGVVITPEEVERRYAGVSLDILFGELLEGKDADIASLIQEKRERMSQEPIPPVPGAIELIQSLHAKGYKLAVASASTMPYINQVITSLSLTDYFGAICSTKECEHGKPEPDVFLLAAERLGSKPEECLVIEDGYSGMVAAAKAGMNCIGLVPDASKQYPTQNLVTSLSEINFEKIRKL